MELVRAQASRAHKLILIFFFFLIAIANLLEEEGAAQPHPLLLSVHLGEAVLIRGECGDWFYAHTVDGHKEGIIPKSYLHIKDSSFIING
jgi:hypothetical protein